MKRRLENSKLYAVRVLVTLAAVLACAYCIRIWYFNNRGAAAIIEQHTAAAAPHQIIAWQDAGSYYRSYVTAEGIIAASHKTDKVCLLNFHKDYSKYLTLVIFSSAFSRFPENPDKYYLNKTIRVSGVVKEYNGKPEIIISDPAQIVEVKP